MNIKNYRGFTIIELLVIIAIVGIAGAMIAPSAGPMLESIRLRSASDIVKRQLMTAKIRAVADPYVHCGVYFAVDSTRQKTWIFFDDTSGTAYQYDPGADKIYMGNNELPKGIRLQRPVGDAPPNDVIVFRGDGSAKTSGSIQLVNKYNDTRTINVLASTGRIKVTAQ